MEGLGLDVVPYDGGCRPGENPAAAQAALQIYGMAHGVPDHRGLLPFVDDVGACSRKHRLRIGVGERKRLVDVAYALRVAAGCPGLAAPLGSRNFDCAEDFEIALDLAVNDAWDVLVLGR